MKKCVMGAIGITEKVLIPDIGKIGSLYGCSVWGSKECMKECTIKLE